MSRAVRYVPIEPTDRLVETLDRQAVAPLLPLMAAIGAGRGSEEIFLAMRDNLLQLLPADRIGVAVLEGEEARSRFIWADHPIVLDVGTSVSITGQSSLAPLLQNRWGRIIPDMPARLADNPRSPTAPRIIEEGILSNLTVPLFAGDKAIGLLFLSSHALDAYRASHVKIAAALAAPLALSLWIDGLRAQEATLIQAERMAAVGQLSTMVEHEIKNRFSVILTAAQAIAMDAPAPWNGLAESIEKAARQGLATVRDLLSIAGPKRPLTQSPLHLDQIIEDTLQLTVRGSNVQLFKQLKPLPVLLGDRSLMQLIFLNLFLNALQAMPKGGTLTVRTDSTPEELIITVQDSGEGMDAEQRTRLFEPFFTTKADGTGLGLSIVKNAIEQHHGTISVESQPGKGSTFTLHLPVSPPPSAD